MLKQAISKIKSSVFTSASTLSGAVKANSSVDVRGDLSISLVRNGESTKILEEKNLVVLGGRLRLLQSLYLGDSHTPITTLRVGTGGTIDPEGRFPKVVNTALTSLYTQVLSIPVTYTVDAQFPSVTYIADVDPSICNDMLISEAGLFFGDGMMFNIKTFPGIPKTLDFSIHFEWTIRIVE